MIAYKELCLDVSDASAAADFLAPLLGLRVVPLDRADVKLVDDVAEHTVWLNVVPEPRTVKNRVHLDVDVDAVAPLEERGARVVDDSQPWTVLTQQEAGELCAFVRPPERLHPYRLYEVVIDCAEPEVVATWWAERFGVEARTEGEDWWIEGAPGLPWELVFCAVPEPKVVKNRVHWDVWGSTAELQAAGARLLRARDDEIAWDVMADPEGNEFCVFAPA